MSSHVDLKALTHQSDCLPTSAIRAPSEFDNASARFEPERPCVPRELSDGGDDGELDEPVRRLRHNDAASLVVVQARHGSTPIKCPTSRFGQVC